MAATKTERLRYVRNPMTSEAHLLDLDLVAQGTKIQRRGII